MGGKMADLMTVGKLAALTGITIKALKHYEKLGLIKPDYVNPTTNYRYYSKGQVKNIYEILMLKELGIPLSKIRGIKSKGTIKNKLVLAKKDLEEKISSLKKTLEVVDLKLASLANEEKSFFEIEMLILDERKLFLYPIDPVDRPGDNMLYVNALKMRDKLSFSKNTFRGIVMDKNQFCKGKYRCKALFQELEDYTKIDRKNILILPKGTYISICFRGNTGKITEKILRKTMDYIAENGLQPEGRIIGFAHRGAHTGAALDDYETEIQILLK